MPIYNVKAPNGKIYRIEGPENADQNVLFQAANQLYEQDESKRLRKEYGPGLFGTLTEGVARGAQQLGVVGGDIIPAMVGQALGFDEYAKRQMEEAAQSQQQIAAERPPIFDSYKEVESPYQAVQFGLEVLGEQIPNIATALIPGLGGGAIAGRAALGAVGKSLATQAAERGLAGEAATAFVAEGMKRAAPQIAAKANLGTNVGVFLGSYAQNAPEIFQNVFQETGQMEVGTSMLFGAGAAALDSVLPAQLAKQISGPLKVGIVEKVLEKSGMDRGLLRSVTSGLIKGVTGEGLTEGAQEAISIAAEKFVADNPQVFESKEWDRIMESSVRGAVAGGGFGVAGGSIQRMREAADRKAKMAEAMERRGQRQEAARLRQEVVAAEQEIAEIEAQQAQGQLPGMETGVYSSLLQPQEVVENAVKGAKQTLSGKQLEMFGPEGELTKAVQKAATADEKRAAIVARQQTQKEAAEQKANQEKLRKLLSAKQLTLPGMSPEEIAATQQQQAQIQAQVAETGQGDLFAGAPPAAAPAPAPTPEPVKRAPPSGIEGTIISSSKEGLAALGKQFGIGPTARILRPDGPLAGKDLSNPAQAAEVKQALEAYASGKPAAGATAKIEEFLKRPEFQALETEVKEDGRPTTDFISGAAEPSVPSVRRPGRVLPSAEITEAPVERGLGEAGVPTALPTEGERGVERPLGVRETKDVAKAEAGTEKAVREQASFVEANDDRTNNALTGLLREAANAAGVDPDLVASEDLRGTPAHTYLRLPGLLNEYFRLKDVLAIPATDAASRAQSTRNQQELGVIRNAILQSGPDMGPFLQEMESASVAQREAVASQINREAKAQFEPIIKQKLAAAKEQMPEKAAAPAAPKVDERLEKIRAAAQKAKPATGKAAEKAKESFAKEYEKRTGEKLLLPVHRGPDLNDAGKTLVQAGDLSGAIDHLRSLTTNRAVRTILNKVKSLNLKTKIVVGSVGEGQAGSFDPRTNTITIDPENGMNEHTVLHELMHAAISHVLRNPNIPVTKQLTTLFEQLRNQFGDAYGGQDLQEFASELVSNPEFQALLKTIKAPKSKSMFVRFMQTLAEFFGFGKGTSAYDKGLKLVTDAVDISSNVDPTVGDLLFLSTPNGASTGFGVVGRIGQAMPNLAGRTVETTKNYFSNMPRDIKSLGMGLLRLDNINTIYGKELPSIQRLLDGLERRNGMQEKLIEKVNDNYKFFSRTQQKFPKQFEVMQDMAYDARLDMADPKDPNFLKTPGLSQAQQAAYKKHRATYLSLPADVRKTYDMIRDSYADAINEYETMLVGDPDRGIPGLVEKSLAAKLKAEFQARKRQIAYIPFLRKGEFWVEYDENGERAASAFESMRERDRFIKEVLEPKKIQSRVYQNLENTSFQQGNLPPTSFIVRVMNDLNQQGASQQLKDQVYQSYLALFPAESIAKNFMKADNVRGMERDIVRGYGETMIKWSRRLANTRYTPEIDRAVNDIQTEAENVNTPEVYAAAQNIMDQREFFHNPSYGKLVSAATTISYFNYIAGNVSSAIVNLSTLPMFSWSILGAKFGFDKASGALLSASKTTINYIFNGQIPKQYEALFAELNDHAQLEHTLAREVLEGRRETTSDYIGAKAKILDLLSLPFHKTEILNRGATAIAAYDLARGKGMTDQESIRYALRTVKEINTSGLSATAPRYMQHPLGRVFFTFKSFVWNSAFVVARAFHQAVKGESPEVRREAFRQLVGIYGMAMAFAGIKGLPFMGATSTLVTMINALLGDEDEPFDFDVEMRNLTNEFFYKGLVNYITNTEVANRTGVANDLIFRDDPRSVAEHGYILTAMKQAFGPAGSFAFGVGNGAQLMADGEVWRGIEAMVPSFIRNGMKAIRFGQEGATTLKGEPIVDDISAYNVLMQVIGFSPANLSNVYEELSLKKGYERDIQQKRTKLLNKYDMARKAGDYDLMMEVQRDISKFNERRIDPKAKITRDTLQRSIKAREAAEKNMINGVRFNKSLMPEIDKLLEEDEE